MTVKIDMVRCACGCGGMISRDDFVRERALSELAGPPTGSRVNLTSTSGGVYRREPPEPTTTLRCHRCGYEFALMTFLADFLKQWGMGRPTCQGCHRGSE